MFVFGLFWMLKLKFCIPPSIELEAELSAELTWCRAGSVQASLEVDVDVLPGHRPGRRAGGRCCATGLDADRPGQDLGTKLTAELHQRPGRRAAGPRRGTAIPAGTPFPVFGADAVRAHRRGRRDEVVHP